MHKLGNVIRKVRKEDREEIAAILTAAFGQQDEAELVKQLWTENAIKFQRLAEVGGAVIGYCAFTPITCKPALDGLLLGMGPLAVAPDHQRQGVGAALVEEGLKVCRENKARLVAVLGDPDYYDRFGFEPAAEKKMTWAGFDAGDAFRIIIGEPGLTDETDAEDIRVIHYHTAFDTVS